MVDGSRPLEIEGGGEEDEVEVVGEDLEVGGEGRLGLSLRAEGDSKSE